MAVCPEPCSIRKNNDIRYPGICMEQGVQGRVTDFILN